jgi:soluble lytic murein transglycosylase
LCSLTLADSQSLAAAQKRISESVLAKDYPSAISQLQDLRKDDLKAFEANNYDYLLARITERTGDVANAMALYQNAAKRGSVLKPYALWHLSQLSRSSGNLVLERLYLQELIASAPESLLSLAAQNRLARSFFESRDYEEVIRLLNSISAKPAAPKQPASETAVYRQNLLLLGRSFLQLDKAPEARNIFVRIIDETTNPGQPDDLALAAVDGLDSIDVAGSVEMPDIEHFRRATIYQFNRSWEKARVHYDTILSKYPQSGIAPDAAFQIGRGYQQEGELTEAVRWFERVQEQYPEHQAAKDALLQSASTYSRLARYKESIARYKKFIEKYPDDERVDRAYLNIIDVLRDSGEENEALAWSAKTQEVYRGKLPEALALFSDAKLNMARSDWSSALSKLDRLAMMPDLGGIRVPGGTNPPEISFLRGFALEQLERFPEAIDMYLSVADGRAEYYGGRATDRLRLLAVDTKAGKYVDQKVLTLLAGIRSKDPDITRKNLQSIIRLTDSEETQDQYLSSLRSIYKSLPAYSKVPTFGNVSLGRTKLIDRSADQGSAADELLFLDLCDEAAPEYVAGVKGTALAADNSFALARCYLKGDVADRAVAFIEPLWKNVPADYQIELIPKEQLEMLYPAPYSDLLRKSAAPRSVDPRFVLSIMRQESRFRADIKSYAAARGLMQFISSTANTVAGKLGRRSFDQDELYDPATSILFGSQYLADLFSAFPDQPAAVAASYNGGDDNMKRWMLRSRANIPDRYVPEIAFSQTKDYVYKVMSNYRIYQYLYDENLKTNH